MTGSAQPNCDQRTDRAQQIAALNDELRNSGVGGLIMVTQGVRRLDGFNSLELMRALRTFDEFDEDNDPHGERDFGHLTLADQELLWKIDYYDKEIAFGSRDPANPDVTTRVLTVMLASEY